MTNKMNNNRYKKECYHNWRFVNGKAPAVCINCGVTRDEECKRAQKGWGNGLYFQRREKLIN